MRWVVAAVFCISTLPLCGAETNAVCATCHPAEVKLHERTRMAHAMSPVFGSSFAQNLPGQPLHESDGGYEFLFRLTLAGLNVTAQRGDDAAHGVIGWVLGAGAQGLTPIIRTASGVREFRISYFPALQTYGITVGQDGGASPDANAALGAHQSRSTVEACLGCHASAVTSNLDPVIPGVQCIRCHPGADQHALGHGKPFNPGKIAPPEQVRFCGNCHRNKPPVDDLQLENLRFQPLRLMKSKCFASGKLACTTCHPAHQDARRRDAAGYDEKCQGCHSGAAGTIAHTDARRNGDCIGCHMPYVQLHPALRFTDHYIRIVKAGDLPAEIVRVRPAS